MALPAYDTLEIARELEEDYDFNKEQSEGIAKLIHRHLVANVATKEDTAQLRKDVSSEIAQLRKDVSSEIAQLRKDVSSEIAQLRKDLEGKLRNLEEKTDARMDALEIKFDAKFEVLEQKIEILEVKLTRRIGGMIAIGFGLMAALQAAFAYI